MINWYWLQGEMLKRAKERVMSKEDFVDEWCESRNLDKKKNTNVALVAAVLEIERLQARIDGLESALRSVVSFVEFEEILAEMGATKAHDKGGE